MAHSHNFDPNELEKFSDLASQWWDPEASLKTLHDINPLRLGYIKSKTSLFQKKIIDIGCGGGILSESLAKEGAIVTGIDLNQSLINVAQLHLLESGQTVEYLCTSSEDMAQKHPDHYDIVTCLELLEHVPGPESIVKSAALLVKPGGLVFFSTINRNVKAYLFAILGAEYILKLLPKDTHDFAKFIRPSELSNWCLKAGLKPQDIQGISYQALYKRFSLTKDHSINYLFLAKKI